MSKRATLIMLGIIGALAVFGIAGAYYEGQQNAQLKIEIAEVKVQVQEARDSNDVSTARVEELEAQIAQRDTVIQEQLAAAAEAREAVNVAAVELDSVVAALPAQTREAVAIAVAHERAANAAEKLRLRNAINDLTLQVTDLRNEATILRLDNARLRAAMDAQSAVIESLRKRAFPSLLARITRDPLVKVGLATAAVGIGIAAAK